MAPKGWPKAKEEKLRKLWAEGYSASVCAGILAAEFDEPVTRNAVIAKKDRMRLPNPITKRSVSRKRSSGKKPKRNHFNKIAPQKKQPDFKSEPYKKRYTELVISPEERVDFIDLQRCQCHWPIGDPLKDGFHFCGKAVEPGSPYCTFHSDIAFNNRPQKQEIVDQEAENSEVAA